MKKLSPEDWARVQWLRNAWRYDVYLSTLPRWGHTQIKGLRISEGNMPGVDEQTKKWMIKQLLLTLRCYSCERRRSGECNFSVCIRGLMTGVE